MTIIYKIIHPSSDWVYIGKTNRGLEIRLKEHIKYSKKGRSRMAKWVKSLPSSPEIISLEECDDLIWEERERYWICYFREKYINKVLNHSDGGEGQSFGFKHTPDAIIKISKAGIGRVFSKESRIKMSQSQIGKIIQSETRVKISNSHKGKNHTSETKIKMSKSRQPDKISIMTRLKISESNRKLDNSKINEIKRKYFIDRLSSRKIGKEYGISHSMVLDIANNKSNYLKRIV